MVRGALKSMAIEENEMSPANQNLIAHAKKRAKKLQKNSPEKPYCLCLNEIAQDLGFCDYHDLIQKDKSSDLQLNSSICPIDKHSEIIKKVIADCVDKESKNELVTEFWDLLFSSINRDSQLKHIEQLTRWTIDKEKLKQYGYSCHESESKQYEDLGYILVSIGHYYRSLMDNCSHQIGEHINFKSYLGHWLCSMYPNIRNDRTNSKALEELKQLYPVNGVQELSVGATSWAPTWWLQEQGRV